MFGKKKKSKKKAKKLELVTCVDCGGRGLKDQYNLCSACEGNGKVKK